MLYLNDLSRKILRFHDDVRTCTDSVINSGWFLLGPQLKLFEKNFASYLNVKHCICVGNGTDAIELSLRALGICPGNHVATVANAGFYTCTALNAIMAKPYFLDVDIDSRTTTLNEIQKAYQHGVQGIVVTHLYGTLTPEITDIADFCKKKGIPLIEDCAQAHGARLKEKMAGTFGNIAAFSFYPTKNLGALGDGGAVVTNDDNIATRLLELRQYGWESKYHVHTHGARNSRMDEVQAALLNVFLPKLDEDNARRRAIAERYSESIKNPHIRLPHMYGMASVAHLYVIETDYRDNLKQWLAKHEIASDIHYPLPDYRQPVWHNRYANLNLPNTDKLTQTILTIPCFPEMQDEEVNSVIDTLNKWRP